MERYDYREAMRDDIEEAVEERIADDGGFLKHLKEDFEGTYEALYDDFWADDNITGNGSGSYFFSRWESEEAVCHNLDLLGEAMEEFGISPKELTDGEWADVTIRCHLLGEVLRDVLEDILRENKTESYHKVRSPRKTERFSRR